MGKDKRQAPAKTNVARLLTQAGIAHELVPYEVDENDLAATHIAQQLNEDIRQVFKTLVLQGEYPGRNSARSNAAGYFVCVVPGDAEVDLKKAAAAAGAKKADLIPMKELLPLTGYIRGGCSPVGMKKKYPTYIDETCLLSERIAVSAGVRGAQMIVATDALVRYVGATVCEVT